MQNDYQPLASNYEQRMGEKSKDNEEEYFEED